MLQRPITRPGVLVAVLFCGACGVSAQPLAPLPARQWDAAAAAHLLRRAGFGATPEQVREFAELGLDAAVERLVSFDSASFDFPRPQLAAVVLEPLFAPPERRRLSEEERRDRQQERQRAERQAHQDLRAWWLERMLRTPHPLEEKMTLFWHGHFTSGAREVKRALFMLEQNELLRRHALGNFQDLLLDITRDRAMLVYLDNARNNHRTPNENYARELLELFTLGEGHYTEADVQAAARALTGWSLDEDGFRFRPLLHDGGAKTFLGQTGNWDGDDILRIIAEQPECSEHLARRLLEFFCQPHPPDELVRRLAAVIRNEDYALRPVLQTLFKSRAFYSDAARGSLVKSPVDLLVGTARQLGLEIGDFTAAERALAALGQELMQPPNVRGWPGGAHWINTATLFQRYNLVGQMLEGAGTGPERRRAGRSPESAAETAASAAGEETPATADHADDRELRPLRRRARASTAYDPLPLLARFHLTSASGIVDFYSSHLLPAPLDDSKRAALIGYLGADFDSRAPGAAARLRTLLHLLCSTPEYQMH